jgi:hypothetical protein
VLLKKSFVRGGGCRLLHPSNGHGPKLQGQLCVPADAIRVLCQVRHSYGNQLLSLRGSALSRNEVQISGSYLHVIGRRTLERNLARNR